MRPPAKRTSSALTLLELILIVAVTIAGIAAAAFSFRSVRETARRDYATGFLEGVVSAVRDGGDSGMRCWMDVTARTDGFDNAYSLVGARISIERMKAGRSMGFRERVACAQDAICRYADLDPELQDQALVALDELHLSGGLQIFRDNYYLASVDLYPDTLAGLATYNNVRFLSFNSSTFSDDDLHYLDSLDELRELQLNGTIITDRGIEHLSRTHQLEMLTLNDTNISDEALGHLATMASLRKLHLGHTAVSDGALATLQRALPLCEIAHTPPPTE
jgi:hypothetical protein